MIAKHAEAVSTAEVRLSDLRPDDVLWVFAPASRLPLDSIRAFVADGGTLIVLAEPSGENELLERYGIRCSSAQSQASWNLRNNPEWPIAIANQNHAVTAGLRGVVINEGCALQHTDLEPFLVLGGTNAPFAYAGGVKSGRVIMLGDASLLTNGMLRFRGNRVLAENLIRFSARPRHIISHPATKFTGYYRDATELDPASRLEHILEELARTRLPHKARATIGLTFAALLLLPLMLAKRQRRVALDTTSDRPPSSGWLTQKALRLRLEFEDALRRKLGLERPFNASRAVRELRQRGMAEANSAKAQALLARLDQLQRNGPTRTQPTLAQLQEMVDTAESILDRIPDR